MSWNTSPKMISACCSNKRCSRPISTKKRPNDCILVPGAIIIIKFIPKSINGGQPNRVKQPPINMKVLSPAYLVVALGNDSVKGAVISDRLETSWISRSSLHTVKFGDQKVKIIEKSPGKNQSEAKMKTFPRMESLETTQDCC